MRRKLRIAINVYFPVLGLGGFKINKFIAPSFRGGFEAENKLTETLR